MRSGFFIYKDFKKVYEWTSPAPPWSQPPRQTRDSLNAQALCDDHFHVNAVSVLKSSFLVSGRTQSEVFEVYFSPMRSSEFIWKGAFEHQHTPLVLNGRLFLFDNQTRGSKASVKEIQASGKTTKLYEFPKHSPSMASVDTRDGDLILISTGLAEQDDVLLFSVSQQRVLLRIGLKDPNMMVYRAYLRRDHPD